MSAWDDIARDNLRVAQLLTRQGQFRSGASRAHYAAFSAVSFALRTQAPFEKGRETPPHHGVTVLLQKHLAAVMTATKLRDLKATIRRLYNERLTADYKCGMTVDAQSARQSRLDASAVCRELGVTHARR